MDFSSSSRASPPASMHPSELTLSLSLNHVIPPPKNPTPAALASRTAGTLLSPYHRQSNHGQHQHQQQQLQQQQQQQHQKQKLSHVRIRLTELLLTCAAHTASSNLPRAEACLRLIASLSSLTGDGVQRLSARLATSLAACLLRSRWAGLLSALHHPDTASPKADHPRAYLAFARALPYVPVSHSVANYTLIRALTNERAVHLVDLGPTRSSRDLWTPVLRSLARQPSGPPRVRFTCVGSDARILNALGASLTKDAESLSMPVQVVRVCSRLRDLEPASLRTRPGEALALVSIVSLHELLAEPCNKEEEDKEEMDLEDEDDDGEDEVVDLVSVEERSRVTRIEWFLSELRSLSPKVVVMAEKETDHNSRLMVERFSEALHYYGAVFDSVEFAAAAGMMEAEERMAVEDMLGREMENIVSCEGEERVQRHERAERWAERLRRSGFRQARMSYDAMEVAKRVMSSWSGKGNYGITIDRGCLMICWKDRPLYAISVWLS